MKGTKDLLGRLRAAALRALEETGKHPKKMPGRGLCWECVRGRDLEIVAIKATSGETARNRWFGFSPPEGAKWPPPLDQANSVVVAAVNPKDASKVEVYLFPAQEVRDRLDVRWKTLTARGGGKQAVWLNLDLLPPDRRDSEGSGLASEYPPIKVYSMADFVRPSGGDHNEVTSDEGSTHRTEPRKIGLTLSRQGTTVPLAVATAKAKAYLAAALGIAPDAIEIVIRN